MSLKLKQTRLALLIAMTGAISVLTPGAAMAQTTPTELIDLSLEDLLAMDVSEKTSETHRKKWEFGLSYTKGSFGKYLSGSDELSFQDVLFSPGEARTDENYPVVPTFICQNVLNFSAAYSVSERTSLLISVPYLEQSTDHISSVPDFDEFKLTTKGIGDITLALAHGKRISKAKSLSGQIGFTLPVGSIDETGDTPRNGTGTQEVLPYTMQLGSGTFDLKAAASYTYKTRDFVTGFNIKGTARLGENNKGYSLGNNLGASVSARYTKHFGFQPGIRLNARHIGQINGEDSSLRVPGAFPFPAGITDPRNYGGEKANVSATVKSCLKADCIVSFSVEYSEPLYQNLNGIQPQERRNFSFSSAVQF